MQKCRKAVILIFNFQKCQNAFISVFNNSYDLPMITMRKFHPRVLDEVSIELDKFDFQVENLKKTFFSFTDKDG